MDKNERVVWNWDNPSCIHALYHAMKDATFYSDVGRVLNKKFVPENGNPKGLTRNVFIGAFRRGSAQRRLIEAGYDRSEIHSIVSRFMRDEKTSAARRGASMRGRQRQTTLHKKSTKVKPPPQVPEITPRVVIPDLEPLRLEDGKPAQTLTLTDAMCKFPIGDPGEKSFGFCGRSVSRGPYCSDHARLSYQPPQRRRRSKKSEDRLRDAVRDNRYN